MKLFEKWFMKHFKKLLVKALEQEGKEPTIENMNEFITNALEEAENGSSCCNCYWNCAGTCKNKRSAFYKMSIESIMDILPSNQCCEYSTDEGDR